MSGPSRTEVLEGFERELRRLGRSPRTVASYMEVARRFLGWLGRRRLGAVRRGEVRAYLARREADGVAASTQRKELSVLAVLFGRARVLGWADGDPTHGLAVRARHRPPLLLGEVAVGELLRAAVEAHPRLGAWGRVLALRDRALLELLYGLGLRSAEARAARALDFRQEAGELLVRRAKRGRPAALPLPARSVDAVTRYLRDGRPVLAGRGRDEGRLILSRSGRPLVRAEQVHRIVVKVARRAGLRAHAHAFRRAVATHVVQGGGDVRTAQELLGHARLETTARYVEVDVDDLARALERARSGGYSGS